MVVQAGETVLAGPGTQGLCDTGTESPAGRRRPPVSDIELSLVGPTQRWTEPTM